MAVCSRARQLWLLLRASLQSFVEKVRLAHGVCLKASCLLWPFLSRSPAEPQPESSWLPSAGALPPQIPGQHLLDCRFAGSAHRQRELSCARRA